MSLIPPTSNMPPVEVKDDYQPLSAGQSRKAFSLGRIRKMRDHSQPPKGNAPTAEHRGARAIANRTIPSPT
jgi:hypothetical protein